jgi:hypothetical protein
MTQQTIIKLFRKLFLLIPFSIAISGMVVLAYQSYFWMKLGYWKSLDSRLILNKVLPINFLQWLRDPSSWLGLKNVITPIFNFPLALFLLLFGLVVFLLIAKTFDSFSKAETERISKMDIKVIPTKNWRNA